MAEMRLQKYLAEAGVASRRASEELILAGRVSVNGIAVRTLGSKVDPENSTVAVDGETIQRKDSKTYLAFYKPKGVLSTMSDPDNRPCLGDYFKDFGQRLFLLTFLLLEAYYNKDHYVKLVRYQWVYL